MLRKLVLGLTLAGVATMGSVVSAASAQAGPLTRVKGAIHANLDGDRRAAHDLVCGQGARAAVRDIVGGARLGATILLRGGGGGFTKQKPC
jgi:hypothetical protein